MSGYHHYVINEDTGARMCKDGKWRTFANFGTFQSNVKVYRKKGWAARRMDILNCRAGRTVAYVLSLPRGTAMDASGRYDTTDDN